MPLPRRQNAIELAKENLEPALTGADISFRRTRRFVHSWLLPPAVTPIVRDVTRRYVLRPSKEDRKVLSRNAAFLDRYRGRRCFVIGNGPSLARQDLAPLADEVTIVMNRFYNHPVLDRWQPSIYCLADPSYNFTPELLETWRVRIGQEVHPEAFFVNLSVRPLVEKEGLLPGALTHYVDLSGSPLFTISPSRVTWNLQTTVPGVASTAHLGIMLALFMGCTPIYLLGMDQDQLASLSVEKHFYSDPLKVRGSKFDLSTYTYMFKMEMMMKVFQSFEVLRLKALEAGHEIFNATEGGFLDVYPNVSLEAALARP